MIFIATTNFVVKTYCHGIYCNGLHRLTFVAIKVNCNKMKVIATKNFVTTNIFSCMNHITLALSLSLSLSLPLFIILYLT